MPSSARWLLAFSGVLISAAALVFWVWLGGAGQAPAAQPGWFTLAALRYFWLPFLSGAGLVLAVCCAGRSGVCSAACPRGAGRSAGPPARLHKKRAAAFAGAALITSGRRLDYSDAS